MQCFLKIAKFPSRSFMSACSMSSYSILYVFLVLFTGKVLGSLSAENSTCSTSIHEILNSTKPAILLADSTPNNVRIQVFPAMSDCIQSCCEWESCQVAVLENTTCYNVWIVFMNLFHFSGFSVLHFFLFLNIDSLPQPR